MHTPSRKALGKSASNIEDTGKNAPRVLLSALESKLSLSWSVKQLQGLFFHVHEWIVRFLSINFCIDCCPF